jgi:hypothetical protein
MGRTAVAVVREDRDVGYRKMTMNYVDIQLYMVVLLGCYAVSSQGRKMPQTAHQPVFVVHADMRNLIQLL